MNTLQDRRVLVAAGAGAALLAGVVIAMLIMGRGEKGEPSNTTTAENRTGLHVEMSQDVARLDPSRPLRCFVGGQFVGLSTLAECAKRNGVAAQSLDVGLDESGELAAGGDAAQLQPLPQVTPPVAAAEPPTLPTNAGSSPPGASVGECMRYGADGWRSLGGQMSQNACVQILFDGRCERAGEALYGRWGGLTLRLVPGRVEASPDNRTFTTVAEQGPNCTLPAL